MGFLWFNLSIPNQYRPFRLYDSIFNLLVVEWREASTVVANQGEIGTSIDPQSVFRKMGKPIMMLSHINPQYSPTIDGIGLPIPPIISAPKFHPNFDRSKQPLPVPCALARSETVTGARDVGFLMWNQNGDLTIRNRDLYLHIYIHILYHIIQYYTRILDLIK